MVVAYGQNREMGTNGDLPWKRGLPSDMANFKDLTTGGSVVMGRKTYESIPPRFSPLEERENIVVTRNPSLFYEGALCVNSIAQALERASESPIYIVGGSQIYSDGLEFTDRVYATEVAAAFDGADTHFPELSAEEWLETERTKGDDGGEKDKFPFDFVIYDRIKKAS